MKIIINGKPCEVHDDCTHIDYEEVVHRAGYAGNPSMTFRCGDGAQGNLYLGNYVEIADGMVFNVFHTGSA